MISFGLFGCGDLILPNGHKPCLSLFIRFCAKQYTLSGIIMTSL